MASYEEYITNSIINCIPFNITSVTEVQILGGCSFNEPNLNLICSSLQVGNLPNFAQMQAEEKPFEDITVVCFKDQNSANHYGVVYDSCALEQDPEVIRVYPMKLGGCDC